MNHKERILAGFPYKAWLDGLKEERMVNKLKLYEYNSLRPNLEEQMVSMIKDIFGKTGNNIFVEQPFHCDNSKNIEVGNHFFANFGCTFLDVGRVVNGGNVMLAPNVSI